MALGDGNYLNGFIGYSQIVGQSSVTMPSSTITTTAGTPYQPYQYVQQDVQNVPFQGLQYGGVQVTMDPNLPENAMYFVT